MCSDHNQPRELPHNAIHELLSQDDCSPKFAVTASAITCAAVEVLRIEVCSSTMQTGKQQA